jgi:large subunit ribosomal protein L21e
MVRRKTVRERGKVRFSEYFKQLKDGDKVAVVRERSETKDSFPKRIQGLTGEVVGKRGRSYLVNLKELNKEKQFIIKPIHLKRIAMEREND